MRWAAKGGSIFAASVRCPESGARFSGTTHEAPRSTLETGASALECVSSDSSRLVGRGQAGGSTVLYVDSVITNDLYRQTDRKPKVDVNSCRRPPLHEQEKTEWRGGTPNNVYKTYIDSRGGREQAANSYNSERGRRQGSEGTWGTGTSGVYAACVGYVYCV